MPPHTDDNALDVLLDLFAHEQTQLDDTLLRQCYDIQRAYQYDRDRDVPLDRIRRLVEAEVNKRLESNTAHGTGDK